MINIILLGFVSFFSDISTEMVYPLIPLYLTGAFGATPALVGVIEGVAESLAGLLKVFSGNFTDKYKNKKTVAFFGYFAGVLYKLALIFSASWSGVFVSRIVDRMGKGIRTAPRDVLIGESSKADKMGRSFGIHKMLDTLGSAIGIIISYFLVLKLGNSSEDYKRIFAISVIPAVIGLIVILFVKEKKSATVDERKKVEFFKSWKLIDSNLKLYLLVTLIFTLGNSSNSFLLLRAKSVGFTDTNVVLLYFAYNISTAVLSVPFGRLSDIIGRKNILVVGYFVFSAVYLGFAFASSGTMIWLIFILYGFYTALISGAQRAFITEIAPPHLKGTMLGLQSTIEGAALLPASVIAGFLWDSVSASAPFILGCSLSFISAVMLIFFMKVPKKTLLSDIQ